MLSKHGQSTNKAHKRSHGLQQQEIKEDEDCDEASATQDDDADSNHDDDDDDDIHSVGNNDFNYTLPGNDWRTNRHKYPGPPSKDHPDVNHVLKSAAKAQTVAKH